MKDYYRILGVAENASEEEIRSAFRRLAFQHHPGTCSGDKEQAEAIFKEVNEAYGVLGDRLKRQQYDHARQGLPSGAGAAGFRYSQQDIFRDIMANQTMFDDLNRMFHQAGLRFDQDFLNHVFFEGSGIVFQFFAGPGGVSQRVYNFGSGLTNRAYAQAEMPAYRPNWLERFTLKIAAKVGRFALRQLLGVRDEPSYEPSLDQHISLEIPAAEAATGSEESVTFKRGNRTGKLMVRIPPGVKEGARIRLRGAGAVAHHKQGDLYLHIKIKD